MKQVANLLPTVHTHVLLTAFDLFPTAKGASTHISHTIEAIRSQGFKVTLVCLGHPAEITPDHAELDVKVHHYTGIHANFLKRAEAFGAFLCAIIDETEHAFSYVHFRDIWGAIPILDHPKLTDAKKIFEVNAFSSIELPMRYPHLFKQAVLSHEIKSMELECLVKADKIITVSQVNADFIRSYGISNSKISIIPNCAHANNSFKHKTDRPADHADSYILYVGSLSSWQGVSTLLKAFHLVVQCNVQNIKLLICSSTNKQVKKYKKIIARLDIASFVEIRVAVNKAELLNIYQHALFSIAPLAHCDRNELQGCSPLKMIESMASGTPVIASDLPVCREIIRDQENGLLISADEPRALAKAMLHLLQNPQHLVRMSKQCELDIQVCYSYTLFKEKLISQYTFDLQ